MGGRAAKIGVETRMERQSLSAHQAAEPPENLIFKDV